MANTVANKAKNIAADAVVAATIEIQLHTAAGANSNGTSGTILTTRKNLTAGRFGAASAGVCRYRQRRGFRGALYLAIEDGACVFGMAIK